MQRYDISDAAILSSVAEELLAMLPEHNAAVVLALHGDLGAGKTTFVQTLAHALGVRETVASPTFVIMKRYETNDARFATLIHIDAYRLDHPEEMLPLKFTEVRTEPHTLVCIEWAERITPLLPPQTLHLTFSLTGDTRTLTVSEVHHG